MTNPTGSVTDPLVTYFLEQMDLAKQAAMPHTIMWVMYQADANQKAIRTYRTDSPKPGLNNTELTNLGKQLGQIIRNDNIKPDGFIMALPTYRTLNPKQQQGDLPTGFDITIMMLNPNGTVMETNWLRNFSIDWQKNRLTEYRDLSDVTISPLLIALWNEFRTAAGLPDMETMAEHDAKSLHTATALLDTMVEAASEAMHADPNQPFPFVLTTLHNITDPEPDNWHVNATSDLGEAPADQYPALISTACDLIRVNEEQMLHIVATQHCASTPAHQRVAYFTAMLSRSNGCPYAMQITKVMGIGKCGRLIPLPLDDYKNDLTSAVWEIFYTIEPKKE